ncbi:FmdE family protein [Desulfitobacterium sp. Sab5]|uniref:FmdE family protein n=1 Tax=Desulfitobacterium nosdiversum TaxID=3375356 RepID=UPI003CEF66BD
MLVLTDHFEEDIEKAHKFHGHVCTGIVFGVRIARAGLNYLGIEDPSKNKDFLVYVEADRCIADAVQSVTGCSLGKRRLKWMDYGKMAASFIDINTQKGIRIVVDHKQRMPSDADNVTFWNQFSNEELFRFEPITVALNPEDLPSKPIRKATCEICQEKILDGRERQKDGKILCKACADGAYYQKI